MGRGLDGVWSEDWNGEVAGVAVYAMREKSASLKGRICFER